MPAVVRSGEFTVAASLTIDAVPEQVWAVLVDFSHYEAWNSFVPKARASAQVGSRLAMRVQMRKNWLVGVSTRITIVDPPARLAWRTRYPRWLLFSERTQVLTPLAPHLTHYQTSETFTGLLAPLLKFLLEKDLQRGFESMAHNLKRRTEEFPQQT